MRKAAFIAAGMLLFAAVTGLTAYADTAATAVIRNGQYVTDSSAAAAKPGPGTSNIGASGEVSSELSDSVISTIPAADDIAQASVSEAGTAAGAVPEDAVDSVGTLEPGRLNVPESAEVLAVLEGGRNTDSGTFTLLTRGRASDGSSYWTKVLETPAKYGMNGLYKEKEGDARTPVGVFKMNVPFGIKEAEAGFPENYIKVDNTYYWNGDSDSDRYNRLVRTTEYNSFNKSRSEHLIDYSGYYNYCINTGYNPEGTAHKGSAIFLHCMVNNSNTHGCIGISEAAMIEVLKAYREGSTYMAIYNREAPSELYRQQ